MASGDIQGTVTDNDGNPIDGLTIYLINEDNPSQVVTTTTDANGDYLFDDHPDAASSSDTYHVVAGAYDDGTDLFNTFSKPQVTADLRAPFFDVSISSTNEPITEGNDLNVDYSVNNTGGNGTQDITLEIDNTQEDSDSGVTIAGGGSTTGTLTWPTVDGEAGDYTATVLSDDDSVSTNITVEADIPDSVVTRYNYEDPSTSDKALDTVGNTDATINTNASDPFSTDASVGSYALEHDRSNSDSSTSDSQVDLIGLGSDDTFGIAGWAKPSQINSFDSPFEWMSDANNGPTVFMSNDSTPKWEVNLRDSGGNNKAKTNIDISTSVYYHIVVGVTNTGVEIWVDNPASPQTTTPHGISDLSSAFSKYNLRTSSGDRNSVFGGLVDDFVGLKKAPTSSEVDSLYYL